YRLEVDVSDNNAQAVVVMFNETATALVNWSADFLMDTMDELYKIYHFAQTLNTFCTDLYV
nr:hypothetical protein [Tanacetum cinerariifolium]